MEKAGLAPILGLVAGLCLATANPALAQTKVEPDPGRHSVRVVYLKLEDGKFDRFSEIIKTYEEITAAAGQKPVQLFHMMSGNWPIMAIIPMEGGMADLDYKTPASDAKWTDAAIRKLGSKEAFDTLDKEFNSLIADSTSELGHWHEAGK
ncbi:MAG TPA: hypothetical protein VHN58_06330 [Croceicoccus sp.]|nr:hypothetical protein [Croceicoccus sp.]